MDGPKLTEFSAREEEMIRLALAVLGGVGYDTSPFKELVRTKMPGYRGMTLSDGAALGDAAFLSQDLLNHVLEEELRHLRQKSLGAADEFQRGTASELEREVDDSRKFPAPDS